MFSSPIAALMATESSRRALTEAQEVSCHTGRGAPLRCSSSARRTAGPVRDGHSARHARSLISSSSARSRRSLASPIRSPQRASTWRSPRGDRVRLAALGRQPYQLRAAVAGVGDALDVAVRLEVGDELAHRLLGHLRPLGQDADPRSLVVDELEHVPVGDAHLGMALLGEALVDVLGQLAEASRKRATEFMGVDIRQATCRPCGRMKGYLTMRLLFTTTGHAGHVLPLVPLARACLGAGHEVRVAGPRSRGDVVRRAGLPFWPFADPPADEVGPSSRRPWVCRPRRPTRA